MSDRESDGEQKSGVVKQKEPSPEPAEYKVDDKVTLVVEIKGKREVQKFKVSDRRFVSTGWEYKLERDGEPYTEGSKEWFSEDDLELAED